MCFFWGGLLAGFLEQWAMESRIPFECVLGMHVPAGQVQLFLWNMSLSFKKMDSGGLVGLKGHFYTGKIRDNSIHWWIWSDLFKKIASAIEPNSWELRVAAACLRSNCNVDPMKSLHHIILCDFDWCQLDVATCKQMHEKKHMDSSLLGVRGRVTQLCVKW